MNPGWLASTILMLAGLALILTGHFVGAYSAFLIFGILVLSLGITVSAYSGGVKHGLWLVGIFAAVSIFLIAVDVYNLFGLRGWV